MRRPPWRSMVSGRPRRPGQRSGDAVADLPPVGCEAGRAGSARRSPPARRPAPSTLRGPRCSPAGRRASPGRRPGRARPGDRAAPEPRGAGRDDHAAGAERRQRDAGGDDPGGGQAHDAGTSMRRDAIGMWESGCMDDDAPAVLDLPVGIPASGSAHRRESDSMGAMDVPADRYWGAQTERSLIHFGDIGPDLVPREVYHAFGYVKRAAALANGKAGRLPSWKASLIARVCDEVVDGRARRALPAPRLADRVRHPVEHERQRGRSPTGRSSSSAGSSGPRRRCTPTIDVNMGQSSNDTFPTAMHVAAVSVVRQR